MEAQVAEAKEELLGDLKEKTTTITVRDFTPAGVRCDYNLQGEIRGRYNAMHIETVTSLYKPDGTSEYEEKGISTTSEGEVVLVTASGKAWQENPAMVNFQGTTKYQTASKKLAWLNNVTGRHEGTYNPTTGEVSIRLYRKA